jgi:hypothetical protein
MDKRSILRNTAPSSAAEHLILIGLNDLSVLFMKFLEATGEVSGRLSLFSTRSGTGLATQSMACTYSARLHISRC